MGTAQPPGRRALEVTSWLIARRVRKRWAPLAGVALIVAAGGAGAFLSLGTAARTADAYDRYVARAEVGDVVINPSTMTDELDAAIRNLPGLTRVTSDMVFSATFFDDGDPRPLVEVEAAAPFRKSFVAVVGSVDGRRVHMDRPAMAQGRMADGPGQALVGAAMAEAHGLAIGDRLPIAFWPREPGIAVDDDGLVAPLGVEDLEVVGIGLGLPDTVLPDSIFPFTVVVVSPDIADRYGCLPDTPDWRGDLDDVLATLNPATCAVLFRDYSVALLDGAVGAEALRGELARTIAALNEPVPEELLAGPEALGYVANVQTATAQTKEQIERSVQPVVMALVVLGITAGLVTATIAGLAMARELRRAERDLEQWRQLGVVRIERSASLAVPFAVALMVGTVVALTSAWWLSSLGPAGTMRSVEPASERGLPAWTWVSALALTIVLVGSAVALCYRAAGRAARTGRRRPRLSVAQRITAGSGGPAVSEGVRAATAPGLSRVATGSCVLAVGALSAALVFATSLSALASTPRSYGWPWDLGIVGGLGWGGIDVDAAARTLTDRDEVQGWAALSVTDGVTVDGQPVISIVVAEHDAGLDLPVVEGRLPSGWGEVAMGARTLDELGLAVGDRVDIDGWPVVPQEATVTGRVALPSIGPLGGERAEPGLGILLDSQAADPDVLPHLVGFVGIDLSQGVDPVELRDELAAASADWETIFDHPHTIIEPVRPPELIEIQSMRDVPLLAAALVAATVAIGFAAAVVASVRARRGEMALLRALGFTGRQLRHSVRAQAVLIVTVALAVGVPLGVATGRIAWHMFANRLGVLPTPTVPLGWLSASVVGALALALVVAALPTYVTTQDRPATVLRSE